MRFHPEHARQVRAEAETCLQRSVATAFVALLGDLYEPSPLPLEIKEEEFASLRAFLLQNMGSEAPAAAVLLDRWYQRDSNARPVTVRLQEAVMVLPGLVSTKKKERVAAVKAFREDTANLHRYLVRGAAGFRNDPSHGKYVFSLVDEMTAVCLSDNGNRDNQCLVVRRRFIRVPRTDKVLENFVAQDLDARSRLDRLSDRVQTWMRPDRLLSHELAWVASSGISGRVHQAYVTSTC
jgi:hypothetical protein